MRVTTAQSTHAANALLSGDKDDDAIVATAGLAPHEVLGVRRNAEPVVVHGAFRELVKAAHANGSRSRRP